MIAWRHVLPHGGITSYPLRMVPAKDTHTPIQRFRLDAAVWDELEVVAEALNADRSKVIGEFSRWITRRGSKRPERPSVEAVEAARVIVEKRRAERAQREAERQAARSADES